MFWSDLFESKKSFNEAINDFANTIRNHFGSSSFYNNRDNANYVAKSYMMAKKMCENEAFTDITDIYACIVNLVEHSYGYDSTEILLTDTQVVQLNDSYGEDCDTDQDGINDNVEVHTPEEVDLTNFLKEYCKYNKYTPEETADMLAKNSKVVMYNYSSNPILPDSDFDGRDDLRDGKKLDNEYNSINETNNYSNIKIKFNQDYRYFFMESTQYYEELAEMGLILSNMASKKKNNNNIYVNKKWTNNNSGEHYTANNINDFMWYIGMDQIQNHMEENVPYIIGQHDVIALLGKVNNLERNVITLVIGENENYKDILAANYDGTLGNVSGDDVHHQGYDYYANQIYEQLVNYDNSLTADRWKKSYWIVGYGAGGSIANLVAKKFIDYKHVNTNIYCYTYQAPNTINRNNLTKRITNTKYQSIFNIENTDDIMLNLMGDSTGWTKYGVTKRLSVGDEKSVKTSWNKLTHDSYGGGTKFVSNLFAGLFDYFGGMVSGFTESEPLQTDVVWQTSWWDSNEMVKIILAEAVDISNPEIKERLWNMVNDDAIKDAATKLARKGIKVIKQARDGTTLVFTEGVYTVPNDFIGLPTRHRGSSVLLPYIIETAKFYINYIGSYHKEKQVADGVVRATDKASKYYDYALSHRKYPYDIYEVDTPSEADYYTTKEVASRERGNKFIYYYDKFRDLTTEKFEVYTIKNNANSKIDYNEYPHYLGDDCTGFSQGVIYSFEMSKDSAEPRGMYGVAGDGYGLRNHEEAGFKYQTDKNTEMSLKNLGYVKYSAEEKSIDWLQPGDLLCSSNHVEYYVGNNFETVYKETTETNRQRKKKAGVEEINSSGDNTKTIKALVTIDGDVTWREVYNDNNELIPAAKALLVGVE